MEITHATQATLPNDAGKEVSRDAWNEAHQIILSAAGVLVGLSPGSPDGGPAEEIPFSTFVTAEDFVVTLGGYVPTSRAVNGHALTGDVTVSKADVGLGSVENTALSTWAGSTNLTTLGAASATSLTAGGSASNSGIVRVGGSFQDAAIQGSSMLDVESTFEYASTTVGNLNGISAVPIFKASGTGFIPQATAMGLKGYANLQKGAANTVGISTLRAARASLASTGASPTGRITTAITFDLAGFNGEGSGTQAMQIGQTYGLQVGNHGTITGTSTGIAISSGAMGITIAEQSGATNNVNLAIGSNSFAGGDFSLYNVSTKQNVHAGNSRFGGTTAPTAKVHAAAGTASANTGSLKMAAGVLATTKEDGLFEYDGTHLYFTIGSTRNTII